MRQEWGNSEVVFRIVFKSDQGRGENWLAALLSWSLHNQAADQSAFPFLSPRVVSPSLFRQTYHKFVAKLAQPTNAEHSSWWASNVLTNRIWHWAGKRAFWTGKDAKAIDGTFATFADCSHNVQAFKHANGRAQACRVRPAHCEEVVAFALRWCKSNKCIDNLRRKLKEDETVKRK